MHGIRAAEPIESVLRDGNFERAIRQGDRSDYDTAMGYLDLASTISEVYEKDPGFRAMSQEKRTEYYRALESGALVEAVTLGP